MPDECYAACMSIGVAYRAGLSDMMVLVVQSSVHANGNVNAAEEIIT